MCLHLCVVETVNRSSQINKPELAIDHRRGPRKGKRVGGWWGSSSSCTWCLFYRALCHSSLLISPWSVSLTYITSAFTHPHIIPNPYHSLTATLTFSHNLTIIIFIPLHPHPCIQYIHRIRCLHAPTYINTPSHAIFTPTQSHTVIRCPKEMESQVPPSHCHICCCSQNSMPYTPNTFLSDTLRAPQNSQPYFHVLLKSLEHIQLPRESYNVLAHPVYFPYFTSRIAEMLRRKMWLDQVHVIS